jgi:hypothetical protein
MIDKTDVIIQIIGATFMGIMALVFPAFAKYFPIEKRPSEYAMATLRIGACCIAVCLVLKTAYDLYLLHQQV